MIFTNTDIPLHMLPVIPYIHTYTPTIHSIAYYYIVHHSFTFRQTLILHLVNARIHHICKWFITFMLIVHPNKHNTCGKHMDTLHCKWFITFMLIALHTLHCIANDSLHLCWLHCIHCIALQMIHYIYYIVCDKTHACIRVCTQLHT